MLIRYNVALEVVLFCLDCRVCTQSPARPFVFLYIPDIMTRTTVILDIYRTRNPRVVWYRTVTHAYFMWNSLFIFQVRHFPVLHFWSLKLYIIITLTVIVIICL